MKLKSYAYCDDPDSNLGWKMPKIEFGPINMIVGISGSGKTRLLNTITNLGLITRKKVSKRGSWCISAEIDKKEYNWDLTIKPMEKDNNVITYEKLTIKSNREEREIINRNIDELIFNGSKLPKLAKEEPSIALLKETEEIKPLFEGFDRFIRRDFTIEQLREAANKHILTHELKERVKQDTDLKALIKIESLNDRLEILSKVFEDKFKIICDYYKDIFPFIRRIDIRKQLTPFGEFPVFCIKEKNVDKWIPITELSSGMQKILFILTDVCSLPQESLYFIDEYENSLGINAINAIPDLLGQFKDNIQIFLTSHHPYLINNIPVNNWYLCYRTGMQLGIKYGEELVERYGMSKQKAFINLINDSLYAEGIE